MFSLVCSINNKILLDKKGNNIIKKVKAGDRFYTPESKLSFSKKYKAQYGPKGLIK